MQHPYAPSSRPRITALTALVAFMALLTLPGPALARDQLRIVGSSTVFPFATKVAESFGKKTAFKTPVIESTGSGGGLKLFCAGVGMAHPDIANSSRRIKVSEVELCAKNGVPDIVEIKFGFDGIVLANSKKSKQRYELTTEQIYRALAKDIPVDGKLRPNPYKTWRDVDPSLPNVRIEVLGPPPTSGTRDAFVELAMEAGAKQIPQLAALKESDKKAFKAVAHAIREDGVYVEAGENDNLIVQKLQANPNALGIFGFSFLDQNTRTVHAAIVDGQEPTFDAIADGDYPVSRSLYFYVKKAHAKLVPGLDGYVAEFTSEAAAGEEGYLADTGLIPLTAEELHEVRTAARAMTPLSMASMP